MLSYCGAKPDQDFQYGYQQLETHRAVLLAQYTMLEAAWIHLNCSKNGQ